MRASGRGACCVLTKLGTDERTTKKKSYSAKIYLIMDYRKGCRKCGANDVTGFVDLYGAGGLTAPDVCRIILRLNEIYLDLLDVPRTHSPYCLPTGLALARALF